MRIAVDAMGGDYAPREVVGGAADAARQYGLSIALVGQRGAMEKFLPYPIPANISLVEASQVVAMDEHPAAAVRQKRDSSIMVGLKLVESREADAFISAGNSGATMAAALLVLGRIEGVERPALATLFPSSSGTFLFLDAGANADCRPSFLLQFAQMGTIFVERVLGVANPRVGLLSNGEEETKGNQLVLEAHQLLKGAGLNFVGNVEGRDAAKGAAEVVVTDGFTGNIVIKVTEGIGEMLFSLLRETVNSRLRFRLAATLLKPALSIVRQRLDYTEYGGALLLGINGVVIIAHGRSDAKAIRNAVRVAKESVERDVVGALRPAKIRSL